MPLVKDSAGSMLQPPGKPRPQQAALDGGAL